MGYWWDKKVDKKAVLETFEKMKKTVKFYEDYKVGFRVLVPMKAQAAIKKVIIGIKQVDEISAYYKEMKDIHDALKVLNTNKTLNNPELAAYAYGKLFKASAFFVGKLPFPVNQYSNPLKTLGAKFPKMVETLMPSTHGSEGLEDDFKDFLSGGHSFVNGR